MRVRKSPESPLTEAKTPALEAAVGARYEGLSTSCDSLSCGSALELADPKPGEVLVDLGCGRGRDVIRAAGKVGPAGQAVGVDSTEAMLAAARRAVPPSMSNARFVRSDLARLDLADGFADVVVSNCAVNHAPDKAAVYAEVHRVMKAGGRFVISDIVAERELPAAVRADPEAWAACYGGAIPEADYLTAVRAGGFGEVSVLSRSEPYEKEGVWLRSLTLQGAKR